VDGLARCNKLAALGQRNLVGKRMTIRVSFSQMVTLPTAKTNYSWRIDGDHWTQSIPAGDYAEWTFTLSTRGRHVTIPVLCGADWGTVIDSSEALAWLTEFFDRPGSFRARIDRLAFLPVGSSVWEPARDLIVHYGAPGPTYGFRVDGAALVVENGPGPYLSLGEQVRLL
jgi:hypothetical protein